MELIFLAAFFIFLWLYGNSDRKNVRSGGAALRAEQWDEAIRLFTRSLKFSFGKNRKAILQNRAFCYVKMKNLPAAVVDYTEILKTEKSAKILKMRGACYLDLASYDLALNDYNEALNEDPTDAGLLYRRGQCHRGLKNLRYAQLDLDGAIRTAEDYPQTKPEQKAEFLAYRALIALDLGETHVAEENLKKLVQFAPASASISSLIYNISAAYEKQNELVKALDVARVVENDRSNFLQIQGTILHRQKRFLEACEVLTARLAIKPAADAYLMRALCYSQLGRCQDGLADVQAGLVLNPKFVKLYQARGHLHFKEKNWAAAAEAYKSAFEMECTLDLKVSSLTSLAVVQLYARDRAGMNTSVDRALALFPKPEQKAQVVRLRANLASFLQDYPAALKDYHLALQIDPENRIVHNDLAWFLATCPEADFRNGEQSLHHALKAHDDKADRVTRLATLGTMAAAHAAVGNFPEAVRRAEEFLAMNPSQTNAEFNRRALEYYRQGLPCYVEPGKIVMIEPE